MVDQWVWDSTMDELGVVQGAPDGRFCGSASVVSNEVKDLLYTSTNSGEASMQPK